MRQRMTVWRWTDCWHSQAPAMVVVVAALGPVLRRHMWHPHGLRGLASARAPGPQLARVSDCDLKTIVEHCPSLEPDLILFWLSHLFLLSSLTSLFHHRSLCCCPADIQLLQASLLLCLGGSLNYLSTDNYVSPKLSRFPHEIFSWILLSILGLLVYNNINNQTQQKADMINGLPVAGVHYHYIKIPISISDVTHPATSHTTSEVWLLPPLYCDSVTHMPRPRSSLMVLISSVFRIGRCIFLSSFPHWPISVNCKV